MTSPSDSPIERVGSAELKFLARQGAVPVKVVAHVGMGQIRVDGVDVRNRMDLDWTSAQPIAVVDVDVGTGHLKVDHG